MAAGTGIFFSSLGPQYEAIVPVVALPRRALLPAWVEKFSYGAG